MSSDKQNGDWQKEASQSLRQVEQATRDEVNDLSEFPVVFDDGTEDPVEIHDDRTYVDSCFFDFIPGKGVQNKQVGGVQCSDGHIPKHSPEALVVLFDHKVKKKQGRRHALAGCHVFRIPTPLGPHDIPLHEARKYALNILRAMDGIEDACAAKGIDLIPSTIEED